MSGKDLFQGLLEATINHYSRETVVAVLDFVAELAEDDLRDLTTGMDPKEAARVYRVWKAAQKETDPVTTVVVKV